MYYGGLAIFLEKGKKTRLESGLRPGVGRVCVCVCAKECMYARICVYIWVCTCMYVYVFDNVFYLLIPKRIVI